jgi:Uncharacterised nucleotidyltransferase
VKTSRLCYSFFVSTTSAQDDEQLTDAVRWNLLQRRARELRTLEAFRLFREHKIEPILIKGLAAERIYPRSVSRPSVDLDLAVSAADFDRAMAVTRSGRAAGLAIDLHCELRHMDSVDWSDLVANSRLLNVEGGSIRVLRPEDHLRVLCVHWLTDGGVYKERLWDIYYAVQNRDAAFDWERFLGIVSERRRRWLVCTLGLAARYLDLDLTGTPIDRDARDIPKWLIRTVENEWASETKPWPLEVSLHDRAMLARQIKRRLRPNPIYATVDLEGSFDAPTRLFYQIANAFRRIPSSYRRISQTLRRRAR